MAMASTENGSVMMVNLTHNEANTDTNTNTNTDINTKWWMKLLDVHEAKKQILFCLPIILTIGSYFGIMLISVVISGHLGELQLAASTLAQSFATVTGNSLMAGLAGAMDTLCGQGFGAKKYRMMGIYLQANCMISFFFATLVAIFWFYSDVVMIALHQDPHIAKEAGVYLKNLIPVVFEFAVLFNLLSFLQTQSVVVPLVLCSVIPLVLHVGIAYSLVHYTSLGFRGAPIAASISIFISVMMLSMYVLFSKRFKHTWCGFSTESFRYIVSNLKLALPSAGIVCLEYWAFEILVVLAGLMPNPTITTSLIAMFVSTEGAAYTIVYGLAAAASVRVSNELGARNFREAKHAMGVTIKLAVLLAMVFNMGLGIGSKSWAGLFTDSPVLKDQFASLSPLLLISIALDFLQAVLSGVARGGGWQRSVVLISLSSFYCVGMLVSCLLAFKAKLYVKGLWIGVICGLACQCGGVLLLTLRTKWEQTEITEKTNGISTDMIQLESGISSQSRI